MNPHHQAIRRQAILAAMDTWSADLADSLEQAMNHGPEAPPEPALETMFYFDSGFDAFCTISSGKAVSAMA